MTDYIICGAGLFGLTFAQQAALKGKTSIVFDRREHIGGNCFSKNERGIEVHKYGPHIFNTNSEEIWNYVNEFSPFNDYIHRVAAVTNEGKSYSFPLNRMSIDHINNHPLDSPIDNPKNFEEAAINRVGITAYQLFFRDYTSKQWGRDLKKLPASLALRIPYRKDNYNANYHDTRFSGIPKFGYGHFCNQIVQSQKHRIQIELGQTCPKNWDHLGKRLVWSGSIDEFFDYQLGDLEYRKMNFSEVTFENLSDIQGIAQVNYTGWKTTATRTLEWKHFTPSIKPVPYTIVTTEVPTEFIRETSGVSCEGRYYPIPDQKNKELHRKYKTIAANFYPNVIFGGRLGSYRYLNMDQTIGSAFKEFAISLL